MGLMIGWLMIVEQLVERKLSGETEVFGENLLQNHFFHHKSHITWAGIESGPSLWEARITAWAMIRPKTVLVYLTSDVINTKTMANVNSMNHPLFALNLFLLPC
jgi:hypothetical protein